MKPVNLTLAESDLQALDTLAPRLGIVRLRGRSDRSAVVRVLIRQVMAEGCPPLAWSKILPQESGLYFYYDGKHVYHAKVRVFPDGLVVRTVNGSILSPKEPAMDGWWHKVTIPALPQAEQMTGNKP